MSLRLLFVILLLTAARWAQAAPTVLEFHDIKSEDQSVLKKDVPELFHGKPSLPLLDEAIRSLMMRGHYENVLVERAGDGFKIVGKPLRRVAAVAFQGEKKVTADKLKGFMDLKSGDRFDRKKAVSSGQKIKEFYSRQGFFNTTVAIQFLKTPSGDVRIVYNIDEKPACTIKMLDFETDNVDLKYALNKKFYSLVGQSLTTDRVHDLIGDLHNFLIDNRYLASEVSGPDIHYDVSKTEAYLIVQIRDPYRWEFYFDGYKYHSLAEVYDIMDLKNKERQNIDPPSEGAERLRRRYIHDGFADVEIDTHVTSPRGFYLKRVHYAIHEGPRIKIKDIVVQGRISRPSSYYKRFILANSSDLVGDGYYNRADLENGFKNLITDLRNQGFLHARELSSRMEYSKNHDQVTVYLQLEEGPQTQIRSVDFSGNKFFSEYELRHVIGLDADDPLHLNTFEASLQKLKNFYHNQGFMEMKLLNEGEDVIHYNDSGTQARILFQIYEGPRIYISSIAVEGNTFTKTSVILKETDFKIGEILTPQKLDEATTRLNRMGLFSRAEVHTLEEGTNIAGRTLVISVSERTPGTFTVGAGVNNERRLTLRGFAEVGYNNLWGTGRAVSARVQLQENVAQVNYLENEITLGYLEPFLLNTRTRGRVNFTRAQQVFSYESGPNGYTQIDSTNQANFLAERDLTKHTKFTWKIWGVESHRFYELHNYCIDDAGNRQPGTCQPNTQQIGTIGPSIDVDYRDNPFLPTEGTYTHIAVNFAHPSLGSSTGVEFIHSNMTLTHYTRLGSPRLIWANSLRGGYVSNLSPEAGSGVPVSYAYFLGGVYTIRGFDLTSDANRIPKQSEFNVGGVNQLLIHTDSNYYLVKSELRFPIVGDWGGVLFYDGGAVRVSGYHFAETYRQGVGTGLRYNTPVGPIALDVGFKLHPLPDESKFQIYFSIGTF